MEAKLDTTRVMQIGILTHNIQDTAEKWAKFLGIPVPEVFHSDGYDKTAAEYYGKPCYGRCYQAFINFENIQIEFIQQESGQIVRAVFGDFKPHSRSEMTVLQADLQGFTEIFDFFFIDP